MNRLVERMCKSVTVFLCNGRQVKESEGEMQWLDIGYWILDIGKMLQVLRSCY